MRARAARACTLHTNIKNVVFIFCENNVAAIKSHSRTDFAVQNRFNIANHRRIVVIFKNGLKTHNHRFV
ncbi:hypothetical protein D3C72_2421690 [compost metagenome]